MFCKKCGTELMEGAEYCSKCGIPVRALTLEINQRNSGKKIKTKYQF